MDNLGLTVYNNIIERFTDKLSRIASNTLTMCTINVNNIDINSSDMCRLVFINKCVSNSTTADMLLIESLVEVMKLLPSNIRTPLETKLGITLDEMVNGVDTGFVQECKVYASLNSSIDVDNIVVNNCHGTVPLDFIFLNSGSVEANCGLNAINSALIDNSSIDVVSKKYSIDYIFNISLIQYIVILLMIIIIYIVLSLLIVYIPQNINIEYKSLYIYPNSSVLHNIQYY